MQHYVIKYITGKYFSVNLQNIQSKEGMIKVKNLAYSSCMLKFKIYKMNMLIVESSSDTLFVNLALTDWLVSE